MNRSSCCLPAPKRTAFGCPYPSPSAGPPHTTRNPGAHHRRTRAWLACLVCALLAGRTSPFARAQDLVSEDDILGDMPVVLSVTRLAQPAAEAPATVTIIDREMIDASGARTIPEVFRLIPGFFVGLKSGNEPVVTYHGLSDTFARRMQILVDGRSVYVPSFGGVPWYDLPLALEDIERIEVIRGPNTAAYGANAFLGVISIHTYHGSALPGTFAKALAGTHNERKFLLRYGGRHADTDYRITAATERDDEFDTTDDARSSRYVRVRADHRASANDTVLLQVGALRGPREHGAAGNPTTPLRDRNASSEFLQLRWLRKLGVGNDVSLQFFYTGHEWDEQYITQYAVAPSVLIPVLVDFDIRSRRYDMEFQHRLTPSKTIRVVWGINSRLDRVGSGDYYGVGEETDYRLNRLFTNIEWYPAPELAVNLGGIVENNSFTGTHGSPRLGLNYSITPNHTLRAVVSQALRVPSVLEERAEGAICAKVVDPDCLAPVPTLLGDPGLSAEKITSRELGYYARLGDKLTFDARLYYDNVYNLISIVIPPGGLPRALANTDHATLSGVEFYADARPDPKTRFVFGYAYTHIDSDDNANNYSTSAPIHSTSLLVDRELSPGLDGSLAVYRLDKFAPLDGDPIDEVTRVDLRLARELRQGGLRGRVSLVGQSVLGDIVEYQSDTTFRRRVYLALDLEL